VDHVHFVASNILKMGFKARQRGGVEGHDIPVLVRGGLDCPTALNSLRRWRELAVSRVGFPPLAIAEEREGGWFCSLGNGHFSQALNLFRFGVSSIFTGNQYSVGADGALAGAVNEGVDSIILRSDMSVADRRQLANLLNSTHDHKWTVDLDGNVDISSVELGQLAGPSQFEALSKVLDSEALNVLVRLELGVSLDESKRGVVGEEKHKVEGGKEAAVSSSARPQTAKSKL
jgi:hypothetical protein